MNYIALKEKMHKELNELLERRAELNTQVDTASTFEYAKLCGQIIAMYEAIIMVQDMEIEELTDRR